MLLNHAGGEAGIGKSALLAAAGDRARERGAAVVTTTGTQSEALLAFGGLHRQLLPFLGRLDQLPDPQRRALDIAFGVREADARPMSSWSVSQLSAWLPRDLRTLRRDRRLRWPSGHSPE
jgi:hypothetical protein